MLRYVLPALALVCLVVVLWPMAGDAGASKRSLTIVYTGDVVGTVEPCG